LTGAKTDKPDREQVADLGEALAAVHVSRMQWIHRHASGLWTSFIASNAAQAS
jgi:hypothetical protein